jgi:hypothetical protein
MIVDAFTMFCQAASLAVISLHVEHLCCLSILNERGYIISVCLTIDFFESSFIHYYSLFSFSVVHIKPFLSILNERPRCYSLRSEISVGDFVLT